jgi:UDP-N-acetylglucosamine 2-epimerase (non-hydrolysing)
MVHQVERPLIVIVGTRPEGIKMLPVYIALRKAGIPTVLCSTAQHKQLLDQVFDLFGVKPDIDLGIMKQGQDLFYLTESILQKTKDLFLQLNPLLILVQGDTTTAMVASLSAFYLDIPVAHIEAGLRTHDIRNPFPEEMNRRFIGMIARYHFAPTAQAAAHLLAEGVARESVFCTGNTVVDALRIMKTKIEQAEVIILRELVEQVAQCKASGRKIMLLTVHRRESFDGGIERVLRSVKHFLHEHEDVFCFYPYHPNPAVMNALMQCDFAQLKNAYVCKPLAYQDLVYLLMHADVVVTDSGGIQEEAISLGKHVLVVREVSERMEGVWSGLAQLVGTHQKAVYKALEQSLFEKRDACPQAVYGDGFAADKIVSILKHHVFSTKTQKICGNDEKKSEVVMKKVCMLGLGYIGLPTAIILADAGFQVVGFDIDEVRIARLCSGDPVIQEPEIAQRLKQALASGNFIPTTHMSEADYFIIAVPTPFKEEKKADLSHVFDAAHRVALVLKRGDVVIIESTIPVGTSQNIAHYLESKTGLQAGIDFYVAHCPERVLPGNIFHELKANARIIGGINQESVEQAKLLYKTFVTGDLYLTDAATAEMVKLVENSSRDVQIAFAHQVASMAQAIGLDPYEVIELANKHPRVKILNPSCGVGGHCIAVDPWFLVEGFPQHTKLLKAARHVNDHKPYEVVGMIKRAIRRWREQHEGVCNVLLLGATYKADVDDLRESPALHIAKIFSRWNNLNCMVVEPHVNQQHLMDMLGSTCVTSLEKGLEQADIVVFLVAHKQFKVLNKSLLLNKQVLDFCGILHEPKQASTHQEYQFWPANRMQSCTIDYKKQQQSIKECT